MKIRFEKPEKPFLVYRTREVTIKVYGKYTIVLRLRSKGIIMISTSINQPELNEDIKFILGCLKSRSHRKWVRKELGKLKF